MKVLFLVDSCPTAFVGRENLYPGIGVRSETLSPHSRVTWSARKSVSIPDIAILSTMCWYSCPVSIMMESTGVSMGLKVYSFGAIS